MVLANALCLLTSRRLRDPLARSPRAARSIAMRLQML
jgi:hypothetical protein